MKIRLIVCLLMLFVFSQNAFSQQAPQTPNITVTGSAEIKVVPDEAVFQLEVETRDKDLQRAKQLNDEKTKSLLDVVKPLIEDPKLIQSGYVSINPDYDFTKDDKRVFLGYKISRDVSLVLNDLKKFDDLLGVIVKAGITKVEDVTLRTTKIRQHKDTARLMAMKAAKEKATAMAAEIGQNIGKALNVTEISQESLQSQMLRNTTTTVAGALTDSDALFQPGLISVKANVMVSFELK